MILADTRIDRMPSFLPARFFLNQESNRRQGSHFQSPNSVSFGTIVVMRLQLLMNTRVNMFTLNYTRLSDELFVSLDLLRYQIRQSSVLRYLYLRTDFHGFSTHKHVHSSYFVSQSQISRPSSLPASPRVVAVCCLEREAGPIAWGEC